MKELYDRNIAAEWFERGLAAGEDFIIRFMMYWIAFNWLYSESEKQGECDKIKDFCAGHLQTLHKYDAFASKSISIFLTYPVNDMRTGIAREERFAKMKNEKSIVDLITTIYQVRCNLFHGSKSLHNLRDIELIKASAVLMEGYLKVLLEEISI